MAIHGELPSIKVTVEVDGVPLTEHPDSNDVFKHNDPLVRAHQSRCTVSNYVECTTGKYFAVRLSIGSTYKWDCPSISFDIFVDGKCFWRGVFYRKTHENKDYTHLVEGPVTGSTGEAGILRRMKFTAIQTSKRQASSMNNLLIWN